MRPKTSGLGALAKVECERCGNHVRKTIAQLRDHGTDYCRPCSDELGRMVEMVCPDPEAARITPDGRAREALIEADLLNRSLENLLSKERRSLFPQLRCLSCNLLQTADHSRELILHHQVSTGETYEFGLLTFLAGSDCATDARIYEVEGCPECGGDRFDSVKKRGRKVVEEEVVPF